MSRYILNIPIRHACPRPAERGWPRQVSGAHMRGLPKDFLVAAVSASFAPPIAMRSRVDASLFSSTSMHSLSGLPRVRPVHTVGSSMVGVIAQAIARGERAPGRLRVMKFRGRRRSALPLRCLSPHLGALHSNASRPRLVNARPLAGHPNTSDVYLSRTRPTAQDLSSVQGQVSPLALF